MRDNEMRPLIIIRLFHPPDPIQCKQIKWDLNNEHPPLGFATEWEWKEKND